MFDAVVLAPKALVPIPTLKLPVVFASKEAYQQQHYLSPVVVASNEPSPTPTFLLPDVLAVKLLLPMAVL